MKHIKLLNKGDGEARLPAKACGTDICHISDGDHSCSNIDLCWWDYAGNCSQKDECGIDRS